jgi:hypothetical protein
MIGVQAPHRPLRRLLASMQRLRVQHTVAALDARIDAQRSDLARELVMLTVLDFHGEHSRAADLHYAEQRQRLALLEQRRAVATCKLMTATTWGQS